MTGWYRTEGLDRYDKTILALLKITKEIDITARRGDMEKSAEKISLVSKMG